MAGVPSVVKISRKGVTYTSAVDRTKWTMRQLTRRAMQDVGRFLLYQVRGEVRGINKFLAKARYAPQRYQMWVRGRENDLILGVENTSKGANTAWWADQSELGSARQPKRAILYNAVAQNIQKIVEIESQYLSYMSSEAAALSAAAEAPEGDVIE